MQPAGGRANSGVAPHEDGGEGTCMGVLRTHRTEPTAYGHHRVNEVRGCGTRPTPPSAIGHNARLHFRATFGCKSQPAADAVKQTRLGLQIKNTPQHVDMEVAVRRKTLRTQISSMPSFDEQMLPKLFSGTDVWLLANQARSFAQFRRSQLGVQQVREYDLGT